MSASITCLDIILGKPKLKEKKKKGTLSCHLSGVEEKLQSTDVL